AVFAAGGVVVRTGTNGRQDRRRYRQPSASPYARCIQHGVIRWGSKPMKRILLCLLAAACLLGAAPKKPKLVLVIVIDQFRYDYLTRYRGEYHAGFDRLLTKGAVFTNARFRHFPPLTALGHS